MIGGCSKSCTQTLNSGKLVLFSVPHTLGTLLQHTNLTNITKMYLYFFSFKCTFDSSRDEAFSLVHTFLDLFNTSQLSHWVTSQVGNLSDYMQLPPEPRKALYYSVMCKLVELPFKNFNLVPRFTPKLHLPCTNTWLIQCYMLVWTQWAPTSTAATISNITTSVTTTVTTSIFSWQV